MSGSVDERLRDEIEALEAILMDDVKVEYNEKGDPIRINTVVFPSTADDAKQQYVCITLDITLVKDYPDCEPIINLHNPRGLDDSLINDIKRAAKEKCLECLGQPVIFELIELIRERLTESNVPSCQCAVCLYDFAPGDQFTKTQCYHYFHSYCLWCHVASTERHWREERDKLPQWQRPTGPFHPLCPVCREPLAQGAELEASLRGAPPPRDLENARQFEVTAELRALQASMAALFLHQQARGGIIDVEAERSKLLVLTDTPAQPAAPSTGDEAPPGPSLTNQRHGGSQQRSAPRRNKGRSAFTR